MSEEARPLAEWNEDHGNVVWWKFPVDEPAWIGTPNCEDWPGYHTHWTPHPTVPRCRDAKGAAMSDEELARKGAYIMGDSSAAAQAIAELDRRRAAGENVSVYQVQRRWIVGPRADLVPPGKWKVDMPDGLYTEMPGDPPGPCDLRKVIGGYVYEVEPRSGRLRAASVPAKIPQTTANTEGG